MKQETFEKYNKIINRKNELRKEKKKFTEIKKILSDEFFLSQSMINEILFAQRCRAKIANYIRQ